MKKRILISMLLFSYPHLLLAMESQAPKSPKHIIRTFIGQCSCNVTPCASERTDEVSIETSMTKVTKKYMKHPKNETPIKK